MAIKILGHRGNGRTIGTPYNQDKAYEQTLLSFQQAFDNGADGIELDVFLTKDQHLVIFCQDELQGLPISTQTLDEIKSLSLPDGQPVPTLKEALDLITAFPEDFLCNIELKGKSVVEPTLDTIQEYVENGQLAWDQFLFSSFDWDKLRLVKATTPDAKIQPTTATVHIFETHDVEMPGYFVPLTATYNKHAMQGLEAYIQENNCHAIDLPTLDIRPAILEAAKNLNVGFCTHPTGPRREKDVMRLTETFNLLSDFAKDTGLPVYLKVDDIKLAQQILNPKAGKKYKTPKMDAHQLSKLMGVPFLP